MWPILVILTVPLGSPVPELPDVVDVEVDLLETNTVRAADGTVRFTQILAWDSGTGNSAIARGYKVVRAGYPHVDRVGERCRVVWWASPDRVFVLTAREHLLTESTFDREQSFREQGGRYRPCW